MYHPRGRRRDRDIDCSALFAEIEPREPFALKVESKAKLEPLPFLGGADLAFKPSAISGSIRCLAISRQITLASGKSNFTA